jgi:hypothetical protein
MSVDALLDTTCLSKKRVAKILKIGCRRARKGTQTIF